jgi:hypothetical protein
VNFHVAEKSENLQDVNVHFEWELPVGVGPEFEVERYEYSMESEAGLNYSSNASNSSMDVLLAYNVNYTASIQAVNCVGKSGILSVTNLFFGKSQ